MDDASKAGATVTSRNESNSDKKLQRVLVAEDNDFLRGMIEEGIEEVLPGCRCCAVADGASAIEAFQRMEFDVALIDLCLPDRTGMAVAFELAQLERKAGRRHVPLVGMSGVSSEEGSRCCGLGGFDAFLTKPFGLDELAECVKRFAGVSAKEDAGNVDSVS